MKIFWKLPAAFLILLLAGCTPSIQKEEVSVPQIILTPAYSEIEKDTSVWIDYEFLPENADITITAIHNGGVYIKTRDQKLLFKTDQPGSYEISVDGTYTEEDGTVQQITSNTATVIVKDNSKSDSSQSDSPTEDTTDNSNTDSPADSQDADTSEIPADEKEDVQQEVLNQPVTVDMAISNADEIISKGSPVTVEGLLPMDLVTLEDGTNAYVIWNNSITQHIILDNGDVLDIGGTRAQVTGTLSQKDGEIHLQIQKFRQLD